METEEINYSEGLKCHYSFKWPGEEAEKPFFLRVSVEEEAGSQDSSAVNSCISWVTYWHIQWLVPQPPLMSGVKWAAVVGVGEHSLEGWPGIQGSSGPCKVTARSEECLQFTTMGRQGQSLELALSLVFFFLLLVFHPQSYSQRWSEFGKTN